jgi:hypothetical protein
MGGLLRRREGDGSRRIGTTTVSQLAVSPLVAFC